ncbi:hypothetical protein AHF37_09066 [Paragonimus kellicotti]|nr:hypothetical protein AHF37_09066 [Paragonimus kellicotti]
MTITTDILPLSPVTRRYTALFTFLGPTRSTWPARTSPSHHPDQSPNGPRPCIVYYTNLIVYAVYLIFYSIYVLKTKPVESVMVHNVNSSTWPDNQSCHVLQATNLTETSPTITIFAKYIVLIFAILNLGKEVSEVYSKISPCSA